MANELPWKRWKGGIASAAALRKWRMRAKKMAQEAGFWGACNLCKRPIAKAERYGRLMMRPPLAWRGRLMQRVICNSCYLTVMTLVEELETLGARDHLAPEDFEDTKDVGEETNEILSTREQG